MNSHQEFPVKSIVVAECGATTTTAVLIEQVDNEYQVQATGQTLSTYGPPWKDITIGVQQAIQHIEKQVNRILLTPGGWLITPQNITGQGVDAFTVVSSAGLPLKVLIVGLMQDISLSSAKRAVATTYTHITNTLSLDTADNNRRQSLEAQIQAIQEHNPEVIFLVGGTDGGAIQPILKMAWIISMALQMWQNDKKPIILYAGNSMVRPQIADMLGSITALTSVDNIRPTLEIENLFGAKKELETIYLQRKMLQIPGFDKLNKWSKYPVIPASLSFERLIAYLGRHNNLNVIGANIGSQATIISTQTQDGQLTSIIRSDAGVGHSLALLLKQVPLENFHRWLPFEISLQELHNQLLNKSLYPHNIPTTDYDLFIEHAIARESLRLLFQQIDNAAKTQWNLIVGTGRPLMSTPQAAQAALIMLDGLEPWGVTSLTLDRNGIVNLLGSIAAIEPAAAVKLVAQDAFLNLGTVIAPAGQGQPGKPALTIKLESTAGELLEQEILYGTIEMLALPPGQKASLEIQPARHLDIGLGQPGRGAVTEIEGGSLGIIIDARGRPLRLAADEGQRRENLLTWLSALNIKYAATHYKHQPE